MSALRHPSSALRGPSWLVCLVLFCGTLLLFSRALNHEFIDLDDPDYVAANVHVQGGFTWASVRWAFTSGDASNWHPLTWLSHMADWRLFGNNPRGHHATSLLFHALNTVLAFLLMRRLTAAFWTSALCAALFAWHPLRVESVAWVAERKDVLSVFFGLLALLAYVNYVRGAGCQVSGESGQEEGEGATKLETRNLRVEVCAGGDVSHTLPGFYWLSLGCFALGLMCKPMLVTLPFLLLVLDWWPLRRFAICDLRSIPKLVLEKVPFLLLSATSSVITFIVQKNGGAVVDNLALGDRLANAAVSVVRYLGKFFWPFDLAIGYPSPAHWPIASVSGAILLLLGITAMAYWQREKRPWLWVGWLWFVGTLVPVIGIVQVGLQAMADRYTYLPTLGLQLALLWTLREVRWNASLRWFVPATAALVLAGLAARTWDQLAVWKNPHSLHEHALAVTSGNYLAESYLGTTLLNEDRFAEAAEHFRRAIELKTNYVEATYRLGFSLDKLGQVDQAVEYYEAALRINPRFGMAQYNLGALLLGRHDTSNAITHFEAALKLKPDYDPALVGIGSAMSQLGRTKEAIPYFEQALSINATNPVTHFNYANALADLERYDEALSRYEKALALDPDFAEARCNYGNSLRAVQRSEAAVGQYRRALALNPKDASAHFGLGSALDDLGKTGEAIVCYREAVRLDSGYVEAQYTLAAALLNRNQAEEALAHFEAVVRAQPDHAMGWFGRGLAAAQLGRNEAAAEYYRRSLELMPDNAAALCSLGVSLRRLGKLDEAISYYEKALQIMPDFAEAHAELANTLCRASRPAEAIPHFEAALKLRPDFPGASEQLARARVDSAASSAVSPQ